MKEETKEIIKLTSVEILKTLVEGVAILYSSPMTNYRVKREINHYLSKRSLDRMNFFNKISYLKRRGFIKDFYKSKARYFEITAKGIERLKVFVAENLAIKRPEIWDRKWRLVILDIPEKQRLLRNKIRRILYRLGFQQIQKSVFVYPFECTEEINIICHYFGGRQYIKYMIADIIEGEDSIIEQFLDNKILNLEDLKSN